MEEGNAHKEGYKHTPLGWIPETWEVKSLGDDIEYLDAGVSVNSTDAPITNEAFAVLKTSAVNKGVLNISQRKIIKEEDLVRAKLNPRANSIIISRMNTPELVGECCFVPDTYENIFLPDRLWQTRFYNSSSLNAKWLNYLLNSSEYKFRIKNTATGTSNSMKNISKEVFLTLPYKQPTKNEQIKIATILGTWDTAIDQIQQLINQLKRRNKGLLQKISTGNFRLSGFSNNWDRTHIYELASEVSIRNKNDEILTVLSCTKYDGLVDSLEYFGRKIYSDDTSTYKIVPKAHFAYATNHIEEGSIGYQTRYPAALISPMYTVFKTTNRVHDEFLYKLLKSHAYIHQYKKRMEGSIDRRGGLRWDEFSKIPVYLPEYDEQVAINKILNTANDEVKLYEQKLATLQLQKKGLMQKLLTGEIRVNLNNKV